VIYVSIVHQTIFFYKISLNIGMSCRFPTDSLARIGPRTLRRVGFLQVIESQTTSGKDHRSVSLDQGILWF